MLVGCTAEEHARDRISSIVSGTYRSAARSHKSKRSQTRVADNLKSAITGTWTLFGVQHEAPSESERCQNPIARSTIQPFPSPQHRPKTRSRFRPAQLLC
eukprot:4062783-Prymnesium_polylepis.1